jgi:hypothetical protein
VGRLCYRSLVVATCIQTRGTGMRGCHWRIRQKIGIVVTLSVETLVPIPLTLGLGNAPDDYELMAGGATVDWTAW